MEATVQYQLLGGLRATRRGAEVDLGGPRPRRLVAALLLSRNRPVPVDRLIELVWGDEAPASARASVQAYISNLRRALEPGRRPGAASTSVVSEAGGYRLAVDPGELDAVEFERAVAEGRRAHADGRTADAIRLLGHALAAWSPLLPEWADVPFVRAEADRLDALRRSAFELLQSARIDHGAHHEALVDLRHAVTTDPRAERWWALLALAQYRAGHPAAAIATVHEARDALRRSTGLDLGPELRQLEADLYAQAPTLDPVVTGIGQPWHRVATTPRRAPHREPCRRSAGSRVPAPPHGGRARGTRVQPPRGGADRAPRHVGGAEHPGGPDRHPRAPG